MKKLLLALTLLLLPTDAFAQCNGVFPNNTVCGNATGASNTPRPTASTSFPISIDIGATPILHGTNDYVLYNNAGVVANAPSWYGGQISLYPNPNNQPGSGPTNQVAQDGFGNNINITATTTGGLAEIDALAAATGWPVRISQFGITSSGTNPQFLGLSTTYTSAPRGIWSFTADNITSQCSFATSADCFVLNSAEIGTWNWNGQTVYGGTGNNTHINPTTATPNDHFIVWSLNDFIQKTIVAVAGSESALKLNPTATGSLGIQQNRFDLKEVNNGTVGIKVMNPSAVSGGFTPVFSHNIITATAIHGQATAGVQVGQSTTRQAQMGGNVWTALFNSSAETDAFVTYEHNSLHIVGFDASNTLTNGLHYKPGATRNIAIILDTAGATNPIVDDNVPALASTGNIVIGDPTCGITIGGFCAALQNSNNIFANVEVNNLQLKGSSTGFTTFTSANAGASNFTLTVPANTGTLAELNLAQSWTAVQSFGANNLVLSGVTGSTQCLQASTSGVVTGTGTTCGGGGGSGTVTSIATTSPITGGTITTTGTIACATCVTSAAALTANAIVIGAGLQASAVTTTGTGVLTALGVNIGTAGSFVVNGGALGTPSGGTVTNLTGTASININGTVGATTPTTGAFTIVTASTSVTSPSHIGSSAAGGILNLSGSSNASPSGDYVQVTSTGATSLYMGKICGGTAGFVGFAVGNNGQADCTHYDFMSDGTNAYFNSPSGTGITSFRINNGEFMRIFASSGVAISSAAVDPGASGLYISGQVYVPNMTADTGVTDNTACWRSGSTPAGQLLKGTGTLGICLGTSSARYKTDVQDLNEGLAQIVALTPKSFYLDAEHGDPNKRMYGFLAEDCAKVLPALTGFDDQGRPNTCDYLGMVPVLFRAVQKLSAEIQQIRAAK